EASLPSPSAAESHPLGAPDVARASAPAPGAKYRTAGPGDTLAGSRKTMRPVCPPSSWQRPPMRLSSPYLSRSSPTRDGLTDLLIAKFTGDCTSDICPCSAITPERATSAYGLARRL